MSDIQELRVLTVRQPWAWAVIHGGKDVENRVRNIAGAYRGPVAIHAGQSDDLAAFEQVAQIIGDRFAEYVPARGEIIGVVDLVDVHLGLNTHRDRMRAVRSCYQAGKPFGPCSRWADADEHHLVLANPRELDQPIPWKGALGLRKTGMFVSGDWIGAHVEPPVGHSCTPYGCPPSCYSEPVAQLRAVTR